jgi:16S rRNA G527 N7-methylase RsmG
MTNTKQDFDTLSAKAYSSIQDLIEYCNNNNESEEAALLMSIKIEMIRFEDRMTYGENKNNKPNLLPYQRV